MSSPTKDSDGVSSSADIVSNGAGGSGDAVVETSSVRPPAKRPAAAVIEISDTESDDSDICAVTSYQATADEVKRIRGDDDQDYSSSSSSSSYSSDSESQCEDDSIIIEDDKEKAKVVRAQLNPRASRTEDPRFSSKIKTQEVIDKLTTHWKELKEHTSADVTLTCKPFRLCLLHDFLANPEIINNIVDDMNTLDWSRKKMDLYEFHQTADLATLTWQRSIKGIYELLKTDVMNWVSLVTGLTLTGVSASCSLYGPGDHLLAHDDLCGDRRVAFILYLAPWTPNVKHYRPGRMENGAGPDEKETIDVEQVGWAAHMGGALELLATDAAGRPSHVAHSVHPKNNMLAFFQVGADSFHQVGEVLSLELPRLSINGWFHGPAAPADPAAPAADPAAPADPPAEPPVPCYRQHSEVVVMTEWVSPGYMSPRARAQVQAQMEADSEVSLQEFLIPDRYRELLGALSQPDVPWERCGPADRRRHERLPGAWLEARARDHPLRSLLRLFGGAALFRLLADCTDLQLRTYEGLELQRWSPGDFTLLPPRESYQEARLSLLLYLGVPAPPRALCGGGTCYLAPEEAAPAAGPAAPGALVTVPPASNALSLVYCDAGAACFTKYLSKLTMADGDHFYLLTCTYRE